MMETNPIFDIPSVDGHPPNGLYDYRGSWFTVEREYWDMLSEEGDFTKRTVYIVRRVSVVVGTETSDSEMKLAKIGHDFKTEILDKIKPSDKVSAEKMSAVGSETGLCVWCGRLLIHKYSKKVGYHDSRYSHCGKKMRGTYRAKTEGSK